MMAGPHLVSWLLKRWTAATLRRTSSGWPRLRVRHVSDFILEWVHLGAKSRCRAGCLAARLTPSSREGDALVYEPRCSIQVRSARRS